MSYGMLRHGNQSSHAINQLKTSPSPPLGSDSDSDDHVGIGLRGGEISDEDDYELQDLSSHGPNGLKSHDDYEPRFDDPEDEEKTPDFGKPRRESDSTVQNFMLYTPDEEKAVIKKFDRRLVLFVALLYMLSFLDRSSMAFSSLKDNHLANLQLDIGNARIAGMEEDLNLSSYQYEWLLRAFYISYILFEWMTLLWKVIPPHIYRTYSDFTATLPIILNDVNHPHSCHLRSIMGSHRLSPIPSILFPLSPRPPCSSRNRRSSIRWRTLLHVIFLQTR